jgi:hypothetical protein
MHATTSNYEDVKKYYQGTYVKFKEEGDTLYYIDRVDPDKIIAKATNGDLVGIDLTVNGGYHIDYVIPKKTVFQYGNVVVMLSRIPARMWKKGTSKENTRFERLDAEGKWSKIPFSASMIESFINKPCYYDAPLALKEFTNQHSDLCAAALTPRISMSRGGKIMVDQIIVAKYDFEKKAITCKLLFHSEISKLFPDISVKVVK